MQPGDLTLEATSRSICATPSTLAGRYRQRRDHASTGATNSRPRRDITPARTVHRAPSAGELMIEHTYDSISSQYGCLGDSLQYKGNRRESETRRARGRETNEPRQRRRGETRADARRGKTRVDSGKPDRGAEPRQTETGKPAAKPSKQRLSPSARCSIPKPTATRQPEPGHGKTRERTQGARRTKRTVERRKGRSRAAEVEHAEVSVGASQTPGLRPGAKRRSSHFLRVVSVVRQALPALCERLPSHRRIR